MDVFFDSGKEFGYGDAKSLRDREGGLDRQVVFAAFNRAHIGAVQPAVISKRLLRETLLLSQIANSFPEDDL